MGGMAAQIPIKNDVDANEMAMNKVKEDKEREAHAGHDGTWVAHPGLSPIALEAFNSVMPQPNQLHNLREDVTVTADDLLQVPTGNITDMWKHGFVEMDVYPCITSWKMLLQLKYLVPNFGNGLNMNPY